MMSLFVFTMIVLFTPKILGLIRSLFTSKVRRGCGGLLGITFSVIFETILSALYAPIMMLVQTHHVIDILTGRDSGWNAQRRSAWMTAWNEAAKVHWSHLIAGIVIGIIAYLISPHLFLWMSPTIAGLLLSIPLSKMSGSVKTGRALRAMGLLRIPEEREPHPIMKRRAEILEHAAPTPHEGLRHLARDEQARLAHVSGNLPRPTETRGHPDPHRLTAERKVHEARTLNELLSWLGPAERVHVAGDPDLLEHMAQLPDG
jgi:membrane glycosyltransferase